MGGVGKKLVHGWGINDAGYPVNLVEEGKQVMWPFYKVWKDMLRRCHSEKFKIENPAYIECHVHENWKYFSKFKSWMEQQDWEGKQLDKDILLDRNKIYSPETCVFVSKDVNIFFTCEKKNRSSPIGCFLEKTGNYVVTVGGNKDRLFVGRFSDPIKAFQAWSEAKLKMAQELGEKHSWMATKILAKTQSIIQNEFDRVTKLYGVN